MQVSGGKRLSAQVTVHNFVEYITSLRVLSFASSCLGPGVLQNLKIICESSLDSLKKIECKIQSIQKKSVAREREIRQKKVANWAHAVGRGNKYEI